MSKKFKLGVIGNPIEHSLSPFIHSRFAREQNLNIDYQAYKVEEGNFDNFISEFFSDKSSRGLNVTLPLKNLAANIEGEISEEAKFINAVNTITKSNRNFKLESTDGMGFMTDLKHKEIDIAGKNILIVGAGAAVESILFRLVRSEPSKINILNRTKEKALRLCSNYPNHNVEYGCQEDAEYDIIINGSSAGLTGSFNPPKEIIITNKTIFYDLNYSLGKTPFCEWALEFSKSVHDGTGMLVNQAAQSFKLWFGVNPQIDRVLVDLKRLSE